MDAFDDLIKERNLKIITTTLEDSRDVMKKLISYDDMPPSQAFEDSIIKSASELSQKLLSSKLLLEYIHGN